MNIKILQKLVGISLTGLVALFLGACISAGAAVGGKSVPGKGARDYTAVVRTRSVFLYPDAPDASPKLDIALSLLETRRADRQFVLDAIYNGLGTDAYAEKRLFGYDKMYGEMRRVAERIPDMPITTLNWYYNEAFVYNAGNSRLAVISREWEYYTGGAHGMRSKDYYVFSLEDKRLLALNDILRDEAKPALGDLVEAELRKQAGIPDWIPLSEQGFFENSVEKLDDFFLQPQGLGFQWDPYEIAPYSAGLIEIVIPYDKLYGMFTDLGLALSKDIR
ncbi:MAG: RsiV family protein [Treponema sp.]|nr:RsiV family protein [Treponema sp.]